MMNVLWLFENPLLIFGQFYSLFQQNLYNLKSVPIAHGVMNYVKAIYVEKYVEFPVSRLIIHLLLNVSLFLYISEGS